MAETEAPAKRREELLKEAMRVAELCRNQARRPYVLELAGTPKAGKSTQLGVLRDFLKQAGFEVSVMRERAADCPVPMKGHFFFNAWTSATMLAQVLANLDTRAELLILDRGFFDSLVWLELQYQRGQVSEDEKETFERFMLLKRWRKLTDHTVLLTAEPGVAMSRENLGRLLPRKGSIMNPEELANYNKILGAVQDTHKDAFDVTVVDTSHSQSPLDTAVDLLDKVLPQLRAWADPKILALRREVVSKAFEGKETLSRDSSRAFVDRVSKTLVGESRSELEPDADRVQLVAAVAFRHEQQYLLFERSPDDPKKKRFGTYTLWHRCHVEATAEEKILDAARAQLRGRILEDLHLSEIGELRHIGALWSGVQEESNHVGLAFVVDIDHVETADSLMAKKFRRGQRAPEIRTKFYTLDELCEWDTEDDKLETWSRNAALNEMLE